MRRLAAIAALVLVVAAFGDASSRAGATSPYAGVRWTTLSYPGLKWCTRQTLNVLLEQVGLARVSGRRTPVAIVMVTCNLNHHYANVYAFVPGSAPARPRLLQRLWLSQGYRTLEQPIRLAITRNQVTLTAAGYQTGKAFKGLCCPTVPLIRRWIWTGAQFRQLRAVMITRIVMPNVVGMRFNKASDLLWRRGIVYFDWNERGGDGKETDRVIATTPHAGTVIHTPNAHVVITTAHAR